MTRKNILIFILVILMLGAGFYFKDQLFDLYQQFYPGFLKAQKNISQIVVEEIKKEIFTPGPLKNQIEFKNSYLTDRGVFDYTNLERQMAGLEILEINQQLSEAARLKAEDMLKKQYFEHVSPDGIGPADLVVRVDYQYLATGENLAMGNFENDEKLVAAWMASQGHRENILNAKYTQIGIAVVQGIYEGKKTWMAVQEFGRPLSDCPQPDKNLKNQIDTFQAKTDALGVELETRKTQIENFRPKRSQQYQYLVKEYNSLVEEYNQLIAQIKTFVSQYNISVNNFNACIGQ
jgi:hypothetical protein